MIDGVRVKSLRVIPNERGRVTELLRADEELFVRFGQMTLTGVYSGVIDAWYYHLKQWNHIVVLSGMVKLVLYDGRDQSATHGQIDEFFIGDWNPMLIQIPPGVSYGLKCISDTEALILAVPSEPSDYDQPDLFRIDIQGGVIPYEWNRG